MLIPFISLGFGFDGDGISPEVGLGAVFFLGQGCANQQPNQPRQDSCSGRSRNSAQPKRQSSDVNISNLFS